MSKFWSNYVSPRSWTNFCTSWSPFCLRMDFEVSTNLFQSEKFLQWFPLKSCFRENTQVGLREGALYLCDRFFGIFAQYVCFQQCTLECRENILSWVCLSAGEVWKNGSITMNAKQAIQSKKERKYSICSLHCWLKKSKVYIWEISVFGRKLCRKSF